MHGPADAAHVTEHRRLSGIARLLSILGHPAIVMPVAAAIAAPPKATTAALATALVCAALVVADGVRKVRRGEWAHVDASAPEERAELSLRLGLGLLVAAGLIALVGLGIGIAVAVGVSGLVVLAGPPFRRVAKLSLHVAFAVFAAGLVWPAWAATAGFLVLALGVGWSRLVLGRHVLPDLVLGGLVGVAAGVAHHGVLAALPA